MKAAASMCCKMALNCLLSFCHEMIFATVPCDAIDFLSSHCSGVNWPDGEQDYLPCHVLGLHWERMPRAPDVTGSQQTFLYSVHINTPPPFLQPPSI